MKKVKILLAMAMLFVVVASGSPSQAYVAGPFCSSDPQMQDIVGFGTPSELAMHYEIFIPALESKCKRASGLVQYYSGDDEATFNRMLFRGPDPDTFDMFWGRDSVISESEIAQIEGDTGDLRGRYSPIGQFPVSVNGLAVAYNLSCVSTPLNLSMINLSLIYLGVIKTWNDPNILQDQPANVQTALTNCNKTIKLTGRADANGATTTFKGYLSGRNPVWEAYAQPQLNTQWPAPLVCRGGDDLGAAGCVASNTGAIGYVSIARAKRQGLQVANVERLHVVRNGLSAVDLSYPQGNNVGTVSAVVAGGAPTVTARDFVPPSAAGCTQAADAIQFPPNFDNYSDWNEAPLLNSTDGYPICYFSFMDIFKKPLFAYANAGFGNFITLRDYMNTIFSPASQKKLARAGYGGIPARIINMNLRGVQQLEGDPNCQIVEPPSYPGVGPIPGYDGVNCWSFPIGKLPIPSAPAVPSTH